MATSFKRFKRVSVDLTYDDHRTFESESQDKEMGMGAVLLNYAYLGKFGITFEEHKANSLREEFAQQAKPQVQK